MRIVLIALAVCLFGLPASAQLHDHGSGLAHGVPDFCAADGGALNILAGQTRTISGPLTESCLGIHGTVTLDSTARLRVETILVYDDGSLTVQNGAEIVYRDTPLDDAVDPEHYSHGLIAFGKVRVNGAVVTPFVRLTSDVPQGATTLALPVPADWTVGQRLWVPDTRQLVYGDLVPGSFYSTISARVVDQSETCAVIAVTTTSVTCAAPMQFAHPGAHSPAIGSHPALDFYPMVATLNRGVTFRSENPNGVRAHSLFSQRADVQIRGAAFTDMGRTTGKKLDDTTFDAAGKVTHIGMNQRARYPVHFHHDFGILNSPDPYQFQIIDSVIEHGNKWGLSVHNSSWGLVQHNVCVDVAGACYVTEDGDEIENTFDHNYGSSVENRAFDLPMFTYDPEGNRGTTFWFRGVNQRVTRNVCFASRSCFAWYTGNDENEPLATSHYQRLPKFRGADTTLDENVQTQNDGGPVGIQSMRMAMLPIEDNEAASVSSFGLEFWWTQGAVEHLRPDFTPHNLPVKNTTLWHIGGVGQAGEYQGAAFSVHYTDLTADGITALNEKGYGLALVAVNDGGGMGLGYGHSDYRNVDVRGFETVWQHGGQIALPVHWGFHNSFFQTARGFEMNNFGESGAGAPTFDAFGHMLLTSVIEWNSVDFAPLLGKPLKTIQPMFGRDTSRGYEGTRRIRLNICGYMGDPACFRVYFTGQAPNLPAPLFFPVAPGTGQTHDLGCPEVLSNAECWAKFHMATLMQLAPADATIRPEISGLIGPVPVDEPDVPPPPPPDPGPLPPGAPLPPCAACVTTAGFMGHTYTLGAPHNGNFDLLRDGAGFGGQGIEFLIAGDVLWTRTNVDVWYRLTGTELPWVGAPKPPEASAPPNAVDCVFSWGDWSEWALAVPPTIPPTETRHREPTITILPLNGGLACPKAQAESRPAPIIQPIPVCLTQPLTPKISLTVCP